MSDSGRKNANSNDTLALALARGRSFAEAAAEVGVSERTVRRRMAEPAFRALVSQYRTQWVSQTLGTLSSSLGLATEALMGLLAAESEAVRLSAVRTLFEMTLKYRENVELSERVEELEQIIQELQHNEHQQQGEASAPPGPATGRGEETD